MGIDKRGHTKTFAHIVELSVEHGRPRPGKLPKAEAAVWRSIVNAMPHGYFGPENSHLLRMLCSHVTTAEVVGWELAAACAANDMEKVDTLSEIHARESKTIAFLSTKLKLTPRSRYGQEKSSHLQRLNSTTRPWEPKP